MQIGRRGRGKAISQAQAGRSAQNGRDRSARGSRQATWNDDGAVYAIVDRFGSPQRRPARPVAVWGLLKLGIERRVEPPSHGYASGRASNDTFDEAGVIR